MLAAEGSTDGKRVYLNELMIAPEENLQNKTLKPHFKITALKA